MWFYVNINMKEIVYLTGDATSPQVEGTKIIAHICNDIGGWGAGFVLAVSKRWREPEAAYYLWHRERAENNFALGSIQIVQAELSVYVANMIGQQGITADAVTGPPIRYVAVEACLAKLATEAKSLNASVHMPRIGCGLAGGTWNKIEPLIKKTLCENDIDVYVYDFA